MRDTQEYYGHSRPPDRLSQVRDNSEQAVADLFAKGRYADAAILAQWMTLHFPLHGFGWRALGAALWQMGRDTDALTPMQKAVAMLPDDAQAHSNLGVVLKSLGRLVEAEASCRRALEIRPDYAEAHYNLGNTLTDLGRVDEAEGSYGQALEIKPEFAEAHNNLGNTLKDLGRLNEAEASYREALEIKPDYAEAHNNLGNTLKELGRLVEAEASCRRALEIKPDYAEAHNNLGNTLTELGRLDEAEARYRQALEIKPDFAEAHNNLGNTLNNLGRLVEAEASYRRALEIKPDFAGAHSNLLFCMTHSASDSPAALFNEHLEFGRRVAATVMEVPSPHANTRISARKLNVAFVSGDLRNHAVAFFIAPVLEYFAGHPGFSLHAYYNHAVEDGVTRRLRGYVPNWRSVTGLSDEALAQTIRADGIDILIDLSGHTAHNRLLTFARKPTPVQATWIGYPGTTGLSAMDYTICDRFNARPGLYEQYYTEKFARLPCSGAFAPVEDAPPIHALPAIENGYLTFASFNRPSKLGDPVIAAWSCVLNALPDSRMMLGNVGDATLKENLQQRFCRHNIARDRLEFRPRLPMQDYLSLHHAVDIVLDTWPYAGGTTSNHALWMGVPVVALRGPSRAHCQGAAVMGRMGLEDWVADDVEGFVRIAMEKAQDLRDLADLRTGMRERWRASPWRDAKVVARGLEAALRIMWQRWCAGLPPEHFEVPAAAVIAGPGDA